jgi:hypothetical protein
VVACTPHPGLGTVQYAHVQVDLTTCRARKVASPAAPAGAAVQAKRGSQAILFKGKVVLTIHERYGKDTPQGVPGPIMLEGVSPDRKWVLYAIDPMGSASLAADGLQLRAVSVATGRSFPVAFGLLYDEYRTWCGGKLVMTAGGDRISTHDKWLIATGPPDWRARVLVKDPHVAFGALACADGKSVVVQSAPASGLNMNVHARWSIWRVGLDGSRSRLTTPPRGASDESPRVAASVVYFVRRGWLYALHVGRLLRLPPVTTGYYGHTAWPYQVTRSARAPRRG